MCKPYTQLLYSVARNILSFSLFSICKHIHTDFWLISGEVIWNVRGRPLPLSSPFILQLSLWLTAACTPSACAGEPSLILVCSSLSPACWQTSTAAGSFSDQSRKQASSLGSNTEPEPVPSFRWPHSQDGTLSLSLIRKPSIHPLLVYITQTCIFHKSCSLPVWSYFPEHPI